MEQVVFGVLLFAFLLAPYVTLARRWRQWRTMMPNHRIALLFLSSSYTFVFALNALTNEYSSARSATIVVNLRILTFGWIFFGVRRHQWPGLLVASVSVWESWVMQLVANAAVA
jgi:drug/metabolite transporter (DMT)-like permease